MASASLVNAVAPRQAAAGFVVAAAQILHHSEPGDDDGSGPVGA